VLHVGTSGWQYAHWRRVFYPEKLPQRSWLPYFAERFQTVEVNNTFYNLPERSVFESWRRATPPDFVLALKMSRFLTHLKRLHDPEEPVWRWRAKDAVVPLARPTRYFPLMSIDPPRESPAGRPIHNRNI